MTAPTLDEDTETDLSGIGTSVPLSTCITTRSDEDTETHRAGIICCRGNACITTQSDEDTETVDILLLGNASNVLHHHPIR